MMKFGFASAAKDAEAKVKRKRRKEVNICRICMPRHTENQTARQGQNDVPEPEDFFPPLHLVHPAADLSSTGKLITDSITGSGFQGDASSAGRADLKMQRAIARKLLGDFLYHCQDGEGVPDGV